MVRHISGRAVVALALVALLATGGCSLLKKKTPTLAYEERPVDVLYNAGAYRLDHRNWSEAVDYFREVERQHPYSEWARRAILMTAYAHYQANSYSEAIADSERFIALYPGNASAQYAYYLKAICYFEQIVDVNRDQASTSEAGEALREVVKRYPYSEYAADARLKIDMVNDQLAGKEMTVGRYYLRQGNPIGAIGRFQTVVKTYQTTSHAPEALYRLVEANLTLGLVAEANRNAAVLGYNYPGDPWYQEAYNLLLSKGYHPSVAPQLGGRRGRVFPFFGRHKESTLPPPGEAAPEGAPAGETTEASGQPSEGTGSQGLPQDESGQTAAPPTPPPTAKKGGFWHGVLGL